MHAQYHTGKLLIGWPSFYKNFPLKLLCKLCSVQTHIDNSSPSLPSSLVIIHSFQWTSIPSIVSTQNTFPIISTPIQPISNDHSFRFYESIRSQIFVFSAWNGNQSSSVSGKWWPYDTAEKSMNSLDPFMIIESIYPMIFASLWMIDAVSIRNTTSTSSQTDTVLVEWNRNIMVGKRWNDVMVKTLRTRNVLVNFHCTCT